MIARLLLIAALLLGVGCEKTNHESIEKWRRTEKGPGKLKKTLRDDKLDPDLSAHAAMVMIDTGADGDVRGEYVTLHQVTLGNKTVEDLPAVVLNSGETTLLGQSFLSKFASVEIKGDAMVLR